MSVDLATVGTKFTVEGNEGVATAFTNVANASDRTTASYARATQGAQALSQSQFDLTKGYTGGMAARDAYFRQLDQEVGYMNKLAESRALGVAEINAYAEAETRANAVTAESASIFTAAGVGAGRFNLALRTLELQLLGVQGAAGRAAASLGAFALGGGPLLAIGIAIVGVVKAYELLTAAETAHKQSEQDVVDAALKSAAAYQAQLDPIGALTAKLTILATQQRELASDQASPTLSPIQQALATMPGLLGLIAQSIILWQKGKDDTKGIADNLAAQHDILRQQIALWTQKYAQDDAAAKAARDAAASAAVERLRNIQTVSSAQSTFDVAYLNSIGEQGTALKTAYATQLQQNATEAEIARIEAAKNGTMTAQREIQIDLLQNAKDNLATLTLQAGQWKIIHDLSATTPGAVDTQSNAALSQAEHGNNFTLPQGTVDALTGNLNFAPAPVIDIPGAQKNANQVSKIYTDLSRGIGQDFQQMFEGIASGNLNVFQSLVGDLEKLFARMLADMAAQAVEKNILAPILNVGTNGKPAVGGAAATPGTGPDLASLLKVGEITAAVGIMGTVFGAFADEIFGDGGKAAAAAAAIKQAQASFALTLQAYVDSTTGATLALAQAQAASQALSQKNAALSAAGIDPTAGYTLGGNFTAVSGSSFLTDTNDQLEALKKALGATSPAILLLINQIETINTTAEAAAKQAGILNAQNQVTIAGDLNLQDMQAKAQGLTGDALTQMQDQIALTTLLNQQTQALFTAQNDHWTAEQIATLTQIQQEQTLGLLQQQKNAADAAAIALGQKNADTIASSAQRIATAIGDTWGSSELVRQAATAKEQAQALTDGLSAEAIASLSAAEAAEELAAQQQHAADIAKAAAASAQIDSDLALRNLKAKADASNSQADIDAYNTAARTAQEQQEIAQDVAAGWTDAQIATLKATQANEDFGTSMVTLRQTLADAKTAAEAATKAQDDLTVRQLNATQLTGPSTDANGNPVAATYNASAGAVAQQLYQQQQEYQAAVDANKSQDYLDQLKSVQAQERAQTEAAQQFAQAQAVQQANAANASAEAQNTTTTAAASPTSFNLAVGTSEATSNRIAGLMTSQLVLQQNLTYLPKMFIVLGRMESLLGGIGKGSIDLNDLDTGMATLLAGGNAAAGNPPSNT